jgi:hypothetical protein
LCLFSVYKPGHYYEVLCHVVFDMVSVVHGSGLPSWSSGSVQLCRNVPVQFSRVLSRTQHISLTHLLLQDIISQLGMGNSGGPILRQWVMSFQRTNLHLSVVMKGGTGPGELGAGQQSAACNA